MRSILLLSSFLAPLAHATEADIVTCRSQGTTVRVQQIGGGTIDGQILVIVNGRTYANRRTDDLPNVESFTVSAMLPGGHGRGVMLAVELPHGVLAHDGVIQKLSCSR